MNKNYEATERRTNYPPEPMIEPKPGGVDPRRTSTKPPNPPPKPDPKPTKPAK